VYSLKLKTLYLNFQGAMVHASTYRTILLEVQEFVIMRRGRGYPLQSLQVSFVPYSPLLGEEIEWFHRELVEVEIVEFIDEFASDRLPSG
jgi:hypothetical protein